MAQETLRRIAALAALAMLAGCAAGSAPAARPGAAPAPIFTAPQPAPAPTPAPTSVPPPAPSPARDTCGLAALGDLVGKPRMEIPVPVDLSRRRVVCEGCPVTLDVRPERQTIWYDPATNRVTRLQCG